MRQVLARSAFAPSRPLSLVPPTVGHRRHRSAFPPLPTPQTIMSHAADRFRAPLLAAFAAIAGSSWPTHAQRRPRRADRGALPVAIRVDAAKSTGPLKPIWRFFGADEPNYAYMKDGRS